MSSSPAATATATTTTSRNEDRRRPLRPVTCRFPGSADVLQDSNVPFSCVVRPLAPSTATFASTASTSTTSSSSSSSSSSLLSSVPKCPNCGAPHVRHGITHTRTAFTASTSRLPLAGVSVCHLCLGESNNTAPAPTSGGNDAPPPSGGSPSGDSDASSAVPAGGVVHEDVFPLPLRFGGPTRSYAAASSSSAAAAVAKVPAISCPLLWLVVLDGTCPSSTYWAAVSSALTRVVSEATAASTNSKMDHVRVALLTTSCTVETQDDEDENEDDTRFASPSSSRARRGTGKRRPIRDLPRRRRRTRRTWGVWQLSSPTPAVLHHTLAEGGGTNDDDNDTGAEEAAVLAGLHQSILDHAVPLTSPHIPAALRGLVDYRPPIDDDDLENRTTSGPDVEGTVHVLLDALAEVGHPAGRAPPSIASDSASSFFSPPSTLLPYAGGKITFLVANPPASVAAATAMRHRRRGGRGGSGRIGSDASFTSSFSSPSSSSFTYEPPVGGSGGRIAFPQVVGHRFPFDPPPGTAAATTARSRSTDKRDDDNDNDVVDWSPDKLQDLYPHLDPDLPLILSSAGRECAKAAIGVDVLCLVEVDPNQGGGASARDDVDKAQHGDNNRSANGVVYSYDDDDNYDDDYDYAPTPRHVLPDFGLCWYATLSSKSGAPGPVLLAIPPPGAAAGAAAAEAAAASNRASAERALAIHRELLARVPWNPTLAFGGELRLRLSPGFEVDDSAVEVARSEPRQYQLASACSDRGMFGAAAAVSESSNLWRMGVADPFSTYCVDLRVNPAQLDLANYPQSAIRPVVQACFAYTAVLRDAESGSCVTIRQMRIQTLPVDPLCESTEALYGSVDPEALAVVLFHKLALASFQDGIKEVPGIAEDWLQSTLVSVYQSAERHAARAKTEEELRSVRDRNASPAFYENERLLGRGGELSEEQVLLAQGHDRLRSVALMTYLIMNCDAFRYDPRRTVPLDLRMAALTQMQDMTPGTLTRCIAPRVQLWSSAKGEVEPILDVLDLRAYSVSSTLDEFNQYDLVLFVDTPYVIAVIDGQYWSHHRAHNGTLNGTSQRGADSKNSSLPLVLGPALKRAIADATASYRSPPLPFREVDYYSPKYAARAVGLLLDVMVEDAASPSTNHDNYDAWKADIAATVRE